LLITNLALKYAEVKEIFTNLPKVLTKV